MTSSFDLRRLSFPTKGILSAYLLTIGIGYLIAILYLFLLEAGPRQEVSLDMLQATIHKYYGNRGTSRIEAMLHGSMRQYATVSDKKSISDWVDEGASEYGFQQVKPIFDRDCIKCHSPASRLGIPTLTTYAEVKKVTGTDLGESIRTLARVSHIHLFGISFIFLTTGFIFSLSNMNNYLKFASVTIPFLAIWLDIGSWWLTKYKPVFAYTVIAGGLLMGLSLGIQIFFSLYEMWFKRR